jgi:hypothetical protein
MKRLALVIGAVLLAAVAVVGFAYAFGVPQQSGVAASSAAPVTAPAEPAEQPDASSVPGAPEPGAAAQQPAPEGDPAEGVAPPADPSSPLAIEIPGCVCHSDDPALVKQHSAYRMNQCAGCHVGGVPTGQ